MIKMKNVAETHLLLLDIKTDKSHLVVINDVKETPILTFDSSLNCINNEGQYVAKISVDAEGNWLVKNELGIKTTPIPVSEVESIFKVEAEFCEKWLIMKEDVI